MTTMSNDRKMASDPTSWGIDLPDSFPEVRLEKSPFTPDQEARVDAAWVPGVDGAYLSASDSADARQKAGWAYRDALSFAAMAAWFDTCEERERQQVAQEFSADNTEALLALLLDEIVKLRKTCNTTPEAT